MRIIALWGARICRSMRSMPRGMALRASGGPTLGACGGLACCGVLTTGLRDNLVGVSSPMGCMYPSADLDMLTT